MKKFGKAILAISALAASAAFGADAVVTVPPSAAANSAPKTIRLVGSDLLKPYIQAKVEELAKKGEVPLECNLNGTYEARKKLAKGECDIAIIAMPSGAKAPKGCTMLPLAYQAAIVIVNSVNPLEEISTAQLFGIYSKMANPRFEVWNQLNVNSIGMRNVMAVTTGFSDNVVVELFKYSALSGTNLGSWVNVVDKKQDIYNIIKANNSAIAVVGKVRDGNMIKIVAVSKPAAEGQTAYSFRPDLDSIFNGDYPLVLPFYVAFKKENSAKLRHIAAIILSDDVADEINKSDFFAAPKNSREKSIFDVDIEK